MPKKAVVPDAWDDDWETAADTLDAAAAAAPAPEEIVKTSKAERLAKHAEANKQIWDSAETPETFHFLAARDIVPLKTEFKPSLKVLSRKPAPKIIARQDPITGLEKLTIEDEEDEEEVKGGPTAEERRLKAQKDREDKQRKYEEVRARLFGTETAVKSGPSSPGNITPPTSEEGKGGRGKGRGRGGNSARLENRRQDGQNGTRELFDPNYTPKPGSVTIQKRGEGNSSGRSTPREEEQIIRTPKGPDAVGKGFGFANRGGKGG